jgi:hypothetical protein
MIAQGGTESAKVYQLAMWPEPDRGVPNEFNRSALFAATQIRHRKTLTAEVIAPRDGYVMLLLLLLNLGADVKPCTG